MRYTIWFGLLAALSLQAAELPVWFDTFQAPRESQQGWQSFRAAYELGFDEDASLAGGRALKAKVKFSKTTREAILIWRFPNVQMKRFRLRVQVPREARDVYLRVITNNTKGDAAFFKPWNGGQSSFDLPIHTAEGQKNQPASPLPSGKWMTYEVALPEDVFYEQKKQKAGHAVEEFALMNTGRNQLNLDAGSRPAIEAFFIVFAVPNDSPLLGRELEFLVDFAEMY